jgi:hypothetical protein
LFAKAGGSGFLGRYCVQNRIAQHLKMKALGPFETSGSLNSVTLPNIPEVQNLQHQRYGKRKFCMFSEVLKMSDLIPDTYNTHNEFILFA